MMHRLRYDSCITEVRFLSKVYLEAGFKALQSVRVPFQQTRRSIIQHDCIYPHS